MKKFLGFAVAMAALVFGCASTGGGSNGASAGNSAGYSSSARPMSKSDQPEWVTKGRKEEGYHYEVGDGKMSNFSNSKMRAEAAARDRIALWVEASVATSLKTFIQDSGIDGDSQAISFMENVSKQTAKQTLRGIEIEETYLAPDGTVFALAKLPVANAEQALDKAVSASNEPFVRKEAAAFAEFKAKEAFAAAGLD